MIQTLLGEFANDHGGLNQRQAHRAGMVIGSQIFPDFSSGIPLAIRTITTAASKELPHD